MLYLARYGEIGLKSKPVRRRLRDRLITNIQDAFLKEEIECITSSEEGRIYVRSKNEEEAKRILSRTFGVVSFSPVLETSSKMVEIAKMITQSYKVDFSKGGTFAIRARRSGTHSYTSQDLACEMGSSVQAVFKEMKVDLNSPDVEIHVEVRGKNGFVFREIIPGPGGFPLGSQGKALGLVDSVNGMVSCWLMMKRGCKVFFAAKNGNELVRVLESWDSTPKSYSIKNDEELYDLAKKLRVEGVVFGSDIENLAYEKTSELATFYPVVGLSEEKMEALAMNIGLKDDSHEKA
ncbi:MAG: hypothetical protein JSV43_05055 [Methanobacteriota archaeon]|nr:MAG: hypothetical protein JSV43_05055 [Euryarchaeota archaeon]